MQGWKTGIAAVAAAIASAAPAAYAGTPDQRQDSAGLSGGTVDGPLDDSPSSAAQTFTAGRTGVLDGAELFLRREAADEPLVVELRDTLPGGEPGPTVLSRVAVPAADVSVGTFVFVGLTAFVEAGIRYALVADARGDDQYVWQGDVNADRYAGGARYAAATSPGMAFTPAAGDLSFRTYVHDGAVTRFTTAGCQTWTVPGGVTGVRAWVTGAAGSGGSTMFSSVPGRGDGLSASIGGLRGGDPLRVCVAANGGSGDYAAGGGASGVARGGDFGVPALIGGGGGAGNTFASGGDAGWPAGSAGAGSSPGGGGTQSAGGTSSFAFSLPQSVGAGWDAAGPGRGGSDLVTGGGAGLFGGGAGNGSTNGGGGGSSFCSAVAPVSACAHHPLQGDQHAAGAAVGAPQATLLYTVPEPPSAQVASPAPGAVFDLGQAVTTSFTCAEGQDGPGLQTCLDGDGRGSGAALDTATAGERTFTVVATSLDSLVTTKVVPYVVRAPQTPPTGGGGTAATPPATTPPAGGGTTPGLTGPALGSLTQTAARWHRSGRSRPGRRVGTTFVVRLDRAAAVRLAFTRLVAGKRSGGRCVAARPSLRRAKGCTRRVAAGVLRRDARAGTTRVRFTGRLSATRRLAPGRYEVAVSATAAGRTSVTRRLVFRVLS